MKVRCCRPCIKDIVRPMYVRVNDVCHAFYSQSS
jgi:hypothetical protein